MDKLFGDEGGFDDEDDDDDIDASETSSLVGSQRSRSQSTRALSNSSSLPISRNASPMPARADNSLMGRMQHAFDGVLGRRQRAEDATARGRYRALDGGNEH